MSTKEIIRAFVSEELLHDHNQNKLQDEDQLIENGIIDSLGIMTLLVFLEEKFSIQVSGDDLVPENFSSITAISSLTERYLKK